MVSRQTRPDVSGDAKQIRGVTVSGTVPSNLQAFVYNSSTQSWTPTTISSAVVDSSIEITSHKDAVNGYAGLDAGGLLKTSEFPALTGDVTSSSGGVATTVVKIQGIPVLAGTPTDGFIPVYVAAHSDIEWLAPTAASGANAIQIRGKNVASAVGTAGSAQDGQALIWVNGSSDFELKSPIPQVQSVTQTTASLAVAATESGTVAVAKGYSLQKVVVSSAARIRLFATSAARTADGTRPNTVPPTPGTQHGVHCDLYLDTSDKWTWIMSPPATGYNQDGPQSTTIYYAVTNIGTSSAAITFTLTFIPMES